MTSDFQDCPCSGKNMTHYTTPWILLILYDCEGIHGYELKKRIQKYIEDFGISINITGLYRHLKRLEKRDVLFSQWDTPAKGPARRKYFLTENGRKCLIQWTQTLYVQHALIAKFLSKAASIAIPVPFSNTLSPVRENREDMLPCRGESHGRSQKNKK